MIYRAMTEELLKMASAEDKAEPSEPANDGFGRRLRIGGKMIGVTALGTGLGMATGAGIGELTNYLYRKSTGRSLPMKYVIPAGMVLGGIAPQLIKYLREKNLEDTQRAIKGQ
jgi:hypothetical protein